MNAPSSPVTRQKTTRRLPVLALAAVVVLAALFLAALFAWFTRPVTLNLSGESESSTADFRLSARLYRLSADLLPGCQYTFYLTPGGKVWHKDGRAVASASGETGLSVQTNVTTAGRYFVHGFTAPEEGCSWTLRLNPL
ncbi:hypothetical protein [Deinococcus altitudinis]|uniref:hypothetical protein n=1 Tax=Deinococcus altitudinis TaxID=468914 RepID=UPI003892C61F